MSVAETAEALGVQRAVIDAAIHSRELKTYTAPSGIHRPRIMVRDLEKWITKYWRPSHA
jgi:excisionase family DNA binding protein